MGPRAGLSTLLVLGAIVLLAAIAIGNGMGGRVLSAVGHPSAHISATAVPLAIASGEGDAALPVLRRRHVISVATDPAFPDPRVTPQPTPTPEPATPRPQPTDEPLPTDEPSTVATDPTEDVKAPYTSPPLAFPLVTHPPGATSGPNGETPSPAPNASATP